MCDFPFFSTIVNMSYLNSGVFPSDLPFSPPTSILWIEKDAAFPQM